MDTVWKEVIKIQKQEIFEKKVCQLTFEEFLIKLENKIKKKRNCGKAESGIIVLDNDIQYTGKCKFHIPKFNPSDEVAVRREKISDLVFRLAKRNDNATYVVMLFGTDKNFKYSLWFNTVVPINCHIGKNKFKIFGLHNLSLVDTNCTNTSNSFKSVHNKTKQK